MSPLIDQLLITEKLADLRRRAQTPTVRAAARSRRPAWIRRTGGSGLGA